MPMVWSAEAEAKLYAVILQVCDVKLTEVQKTEIAARMGPDCTAKAISHKITTIRKGVNSTPGRASPSAKKASASKKKSGTVAKEATPGSGEDDDEQVPMTPPASAVKKTEKKRKREDDGLADGREIAVGEDVGQGFRRKKVQVPVKNEDSDDYL